MAYVKNTWVDQEGQVRYRETQDGDFKILTPNFEQVTEIGTPVNADNMNHIEQGIYDCDNGLTVVSTNLAITQSDLTDLDIAVRPNYIQLASSGTINLTTNSINYIEPTDNINFVLPNVSTDTKLNQILVQVNFSTVYSIDVGTTHYFNGKTPNMSSTGMYNLIFEYDESQSVWVCGWMRKS